MSHKCKKKCECPPGPQGPRGIKGDPGGCRIITQALWFIDPVSGNDRNTGLSSSNALKTHAELECRYHDNLALPPVEVLFSSFRYALSVSRS